MREHTVLFLSGLLHAERARRGTRTGRRALGCFKQAVVSMHPGVISTRLLHAMFSVIPHPMSRAGSIMKSNRQIVADAFAAWAAGTGYITAIFAPDMRWEIVGRSAASGRYDHTQHFVDGVLRPFAARFSADAPFRPVTIRAIYADDEQHTVAVVWDGEGTTVAGTPYRNTYAWFMTFADGKVTNGTAFYDSIAFNDLWQTVRPAQ